MRMVAQGGETLGQLVREFKRPVKVDCLAHHAVVLVCDGNRAFLVNGRVVAFHFPADENVAVAGLLEVEFEGRPSGCFVERMPRLGDDAYSCLGVVPFDDGGMV